MKKKTLLTASVLCVGLVNTMTHTYATTPQNSTQDIEIKTRNSNPILDKGEFDSPMLLDPYNFGLNAIGLNTGKIVFDYTSTSLFDLDETTAKYFNLKLPSEFEQISELEKGNDLKGAITASYKLPSETDYNTFTPKEIDTSHKGQINFTLPTSTMISTGEITTIRVQIDFGKILDHLDLGPAFDYHNLIPNASSNTYEFNGVLTSQGHFTNYPVGAATGYTGGGKAIE